jgi:hypothetical protein
MVDGGPSMKPRVGLGLWPVVMWLVLCLVVAPLHAKKPEDVVLAQEEIPEDLLLDVGIQILDPGLPEEDPDSLEEQRIYAGVRKSEARFIPYHLKNTLESTGHWGAVRVVPTGVQAGELRVSGEILLSTGKALVIRILAVDSSGRVWREKKYKQDAKAWPIAKETIRSRSKIPTRTCTIESPTICSKPGRN